MTEAGADILIPHLGITADAATPDALDRAAERLHAFAGSLPAPRQTLVLAHGGPLARADDLQELLRHGIDLPPPCDGNGDGSSDLPDWSPGSTS
jgi:predicted TIM-barrel enzyme